MVGCEAGGQGGLRHGRRLGTLQAEVAPALRAVEVAVRAVRRFASGIVLATDLACLHESIALVGAGLGGAGAHELAVQAEGDRLAHGAGS